MSLPSSQAHEQIPRIPGAIARKRLLGKLQAASDYKLTIITAPPGYGKSTIAAQYARRAAYPVAWHTVQERERDVPNLYAHCLSALGHIVPDIRKLPPPDGYPPGELAALIAGYLQDAPLGEMIYVLDDVHHLTGLPATETWLRTLVALLPPKCHLILISRMLPNLPLTEMIARREVLALGQEELRLTVQEIYDLAYETLESPLPMTEVEALASRLEGWPAGTVLALRPLPSELERAILSEGKSPEDLFNILADSMLRAQPSSLREFLLASSTLTRMTPELCSAALDLPDSLELLAEIQVRNLFISKAADGLVYHALFRRFLQHHLREHDPALFAKLQIRAARWFEERDHIEESFDHYLFAGLIESAASISERVAQAYFAQGKVETLLRWQANLGQAGHLAPRLWYTCAKIHTDRYEYELAEAELSVAEESFANRSDKAGLADVELQRAMINLQQGEYHAAASRSSQLAQHYSGATRLRGRALRILGIARVRLGTVEAGIGHLNEALSLHRADNDASSLSHLLQDLEFSYARSGRLVDAAACSQEVVALRRSLGGAGALALALNNLGYHYHLNGDYRHALSTYQEGLSVATQVQDRRAESYLLWSLGDLHRDRGAFDEAIQLYDKALEFADGSEPHLQSSILISLSTLRRWQGKLSEAVLLAEEASALAHSHSAALEGATAQASIWAARAQLNNAVQAMGKMEVVVADLRQQDAKFESVWVLGLCAHVAALCSNQLSTERYLEAALRMAQDVGTAQRLAVEMMHTPSLAALIPERIPGSDLFIKDLDRLLRAQETSTNNSYARDERIQPVTYSLRVLTLGHEEIDRDGEKIESSEWRATAAREMFLFLLFRGPATRQDISLAFWPDSTPKQVRSNFHTTLYRARQALAADAIIYQNGSYLINPDLDVWCDAHELEAMTLQARLLSSHDARADDLWGKAARLYKGDFLLSLDADWVISNRESLREMYLEAVIGLGQCARARNDLRVALDIFKRALEVDSYREDIHRVIMACHADMGEQKKIHSHFREMQELFYRELKVEPSPETMAFAKALLNPP